MKRSRIELNKPPPDNLLVASIPDGISEAVEIVDEEWNLYYINQAAADFTGKIALEMQGKNAWEEFPELIGSSLEEACRRAMREQVRIDFEFYFSRCEKWFEIHLHPTPRYLTLYGADITRRVQAEARLERLAETASLNTRLERTLEQSRDLNEALILSSVRQHQLTEMAELLNFRLQRAMQESHHRIKNSFQVIAALVEMQVGEGGAILSDEHLKRINQHIRALAGIHELLTQQVKDNAGSETLSTRMTLGRLIPMLQEASGGRPINADIEDVMLPINKAVSLSLLVSECVSNAIKHAKGSVEIILRAEGEQAHLEVCDDGAGFAPGFDWRKVAHTGLSLIDSTARHDLRGEVRYVNHPRGGGCVAITFPIPIITNYSIVATRPPAASPGPDSGEIRPV